MWKIRNFQKLYLLCPERPVPVAAPQAEEKRENREKVKSVHFNVSVIKNSGGSRFLALEGLFLGGALVGERE